MCGWGYSFSMLQMLLVTKVISNAFCWIFQQRLLDFPTHFPVQKPYLCTEFQSALKLQTNNQARIPTKFLSRTQIQRKRMGNYMKIICSKQIHRNA